MPEQFLHRAQVAAGFKQVAGEAVAQHMRVNILLHVGFPSPLAQTHLDVAHADTAAASAGEQRFLPGNLRSHGEPGLNGVQGLLADRKRPRFLALAGHGHQAGCLVHVIDVQLRQLRQAQTRRIEQLGHSLVPEIQRCIALDSQVEVNLVCIQGLGQALGLPGRRYTAGRVVVRHALAAEKTVETAYGGEVALDALALFALAVKLAGKLADIAGLNGDGAVDFALVAECLQVGQVAAVVAERVG